jgi:hypothetical protein
LNFPSCEEDILDCTMAPNGGEVSCRDLIQDTERIGKEIKTGQFFSEVTI